MVNDIDIFEHKKRFPEFKAMTLVAWLNAKPGRREKYVSVTAASNAMRKSVKKQELNERGV